ncbi:kinase-like domain-containing protein [Rhizophagus clarus]|uniref:Kinase-like domain-containing protein n=1 Tax=Rhizophagus clarus TaxID=94130 RepID=A0A8H3KTV7_9GLOM|nr:kinase-like domain-containing protein [Rhizophagus clarus]
MDSLIIKQPIDPLNVTECKECNIILKEGSNKVYRANWIDGNIDYWDSEIQNWKRDSHNMIVRLKSLDYPENISSEFSMNKIKIDYEFYGITQDPETKIYMMVLNKKCDKCNCICNAKHFQENFEKWTSNNHDIDKFIQGTQLSAHYYAPDALEWIPYNKFYNIKYVSEEEFGIVYRAKWTDGHIDYWNNKVQNWKRYGLEDVILKSLNNSNNIVSEFMKLTDETFKFYGITQDPESKNYIMVLNNICEKCSYLCKTLHFQLNFEKWTSGNNIIDEFIQNSQLSAHNNAEFLEWIPYDRFYDIEYITESDEIRIAKWIDGYINKWDHENQNWRRNNPNMYVTLKSLSNSEKVTLELMKFTNKTNILYGITQDPESENYMMVLQYAQLSAHDDIGKVLVWIPYNMFNNIEYIAEDEFGIIYKAYMNKNKGKKKYKGILILRSLNNSKYITLEFMDKISIDYEIYGITQNMLVLNDKCKKCNSLCCTKLFQKCFENWTSGNDYIDRFIRDAQLLTHNSNAKKALEWIPYNKFDDIRFKSKKGYDRIYEAKWIDGNIGWDSYNQNWRRYNQNMYVKLRSLNDAVNTTASLINEIKQSYEFYGITQDPKTKFNIMVLNSKCIKCDCICYSKRFMDAFPEYRLWEIDNASINRFILDTQLLAHNDVKKALEWISYNKLHNIRYITDGLYKAKWVDGYITVNEWNHEERDWIRNNRNMHVILKNLNKTKNITFEFMNEIREDYEFYGITQDPETKNHMMVLNYKCKECNCVCYAKLFQQNFENWTSGNDEIDEFIKDTQLSAHGDLEKALEWVPYEKFIGIKYIEDDVFGKVYRAKLIDGRIDYWDSRIQNWKRNSKYEIVTLKNSKDILFEIKNKIEKTHKLYGITQDPVTESYMIVLNYENENCEICNYICHAKKFQQNFKNWTSGNDYIDKFIQNTQLSAHDDMEKALEWIPYDRLYNITCIAKNKFGRVYKSNWNIKHCDDIINLSWKKDKFEVVILKRLTNNITFDCMKFINKINKFYGITQDPERKKFMMVLKCKKCNYLCKSLFFQLNFENWTSNDDDIDKFIQNVQLSVHDTNTKKTANWIDGYTNKWDYKNQDWKRENRNMYVTLKFLSDSKNVSEFMDEIKIEYEIYGITQNPKTKSYMVVLNNKCQKCNDICYSKFFQQNFENWTSSNDDIDKFIQDVQLSVHNNIEKVLEWIPYNRFHDIKYTEKEGVYKVANWIDGYIIGWNSENQNWKRYNQNMFMFLKNFKNLEIDALKFVNETAIDYKIYGVTQDPETKNYMLVLYLECKLCNHICYAIHFQQNFEKWTSGNNDIDKFIQNTQLTAHNDIDKALEWIPYNRFCDIKQIVESSRLDKVYKACWIDGCINEWDYENQNWKRNQNMYVILKILKNPKNITSIFINKVKMEYEIFGITQDPETKNYMMVLDDKCKICNRICYAKRFQRNFEKWTSSNVNVDKFIQDIQLSAHNTAKKVLEWIPYERFYDIKYIAKGGFGAVYRANWADGNISKWDNKNKNWERENQNKFVALKSLYDSKNITLEFMNEVALHHEMDDNFYIIKFYGITQNPKTKDYIMVLEYAEDGSLRNFLNTNYNQLDWSHKIAYLNDIASGLNHIHHHEMIHRDLHIGNILCKSDKSYLYIADMGLCKPVNYNTSKNTKNYIYGVLPYVAPEILKGQNYTKAADIYSFGIIMYEVTSGLPPYHEISHDDNLAIKICQGLRPRFNNIKVPQIIMHLIKRCLDANQLNRPTAEDIEDILGQWQYNFLEQHELQKQIKEVEEINNNLSANVISSADLTYQIHSEAIYTSRLLNFNNLPNPKNSYDYYTQNENLISDEFLDSLQIDISQQIYISQQNDISDISQQIDININENDESDQSYKFDESDQDHEFDEYN